MLRLAQPSAGQRPPPTGGAGNGSGRPRRPPWSEGWQARALLAAAGTLYFAAAEFAPFDSVDTWIDARFFWEPIALAALALLLVLSITARRERRAADQSSASAGAVPSELVPICVRCKAVHDEDDRWEPIEAYLAQRTPDKFTRSLCPDCLERLAS
jgi:hypothetical protein